MLAVDRLVLGDVRQRDAHPHVQLQFGQARFFAGKHRARLGAGDDAMRRAGGVAQHDGAVALGDGVRRHPRGIARTDHEQPFRIGTGMHDRHRVAREQCAFLETVDVGLALAIEHAQVGRERTQGRALHDHAEAGGLAGRDRLHRAAGDDRVERRLRDRLAGVVPQRFRRGRCEIVDPSRDPRAIERRRQRGQIVHRIVDLQQARVAGLDRGRRHQDLVGCLRAGDPELGREVGVLHADDAAWRDRQRRGWTAAIQRDRRCTGQRQGEGQGAPCNWSHPVLQAFAHRIPSMRILAGCALP